MDYENIPLTNNETDHNFEMTINGMRSFIEYKQKGNKIYLIHTEVPPEIQEKGVAAAMVEKTFVYLEQHNFKIIPVCVYIISFLKRHSEWNRLLAIQV